MSADVNVVVKLDADVSGAVRTLSALMSPEPRPWKVHQPGRFRQRRSTR